MTLWSVGIALLLGASAGVCSGCTRPPARHAWIPSTPCGRSSVARLRLPNLLEGAGIALGAMRANKLRSALTILGVVIGVATVMTVASLVQGIRGQLLNAIEVAGPQVFYVLRYFTQTPLDPDRLPYHLRIRPILSAGDARALRELPSSPTPSSGCKSLPGWNAREYEPRP